LTDLPGYKGKILKKLKKAEVKIGDIISIEKNKSTYEGTLIPSSEYGSKKHIVLKQRTGYNIGVEIDPTTQISKVGEGSKPSFEVPPKPKHTEDLSKVTIVSTGGTVASRVDYRTGGVRPTLSANDLYSIVPELSEIAVIEADILFNLLSENITPDHWSKIAKTVGKHIIKGSAGVVIAHGTDTMAYTAAALSFAVQGLSVPVILVGSQRSADRPSSDAATNLIGAVTAAAKGQFAEVVIAMHETINDETIIFHRGTKVRKCHTSRRDTFKSINSLPLAKLKNGQITMIIEDFNPRGGDQKLIIRPYFDEKVTLIKIHPGIDPRIIDWYIDQNYKGIILEGTGLGHTSEYCFPAIQRAINNDIVVGMTSQCIWGRVNMNVYEAGRDLMKIGVLPLEDMLPETALVKLMWILKTFNPKDVDMSKRLMMENFAGEINSRTILQNRSK